MNLNTLKANIKWLDCSYQPATSDAERDYYRFYHLNQEERFEGVVHHFGHFESDRFDIVAHYYEQPNATTSCFIVHGYLDHAGLYGKVIDYCLQRGWSVVIFDLPGHGLSTGERASIATFADYQQVLQSVLSHFDPMKESEWYAIGQSTGGAILMDYLLSTDQPRFKKTVLLAPLYRPSSWWLVNLQLKLLGPFLRRVKRRFAANSHDVEFLQFVKQKDPLQYRYISIDWVRALKNWMNYFDALPCSDYVPLIIQGKSDATVDWRFNISKIKSKFPAAKTLTVKEGRHHLANERKDIQQTVFAAMDMYLIGPAGS